MLLFYCIWKAFLTELVYTSRCRVAYWYYNTVMIDAGLWHGVLKKYQQRSVRSSLLDSYKAACHSSLFLIQTLLCHIIIPEPEMNLIVKPSTSYDIRLRCQQTCCEYVVTLLVANTCESLRNRGTARLSVCKLIKKIVWHEWFTCLPRTGAWLEFWDWIRYSSARIMSARHTFNPRRTGPKQKDASISLCKQLPGLILVNVTQNKKQDLS